jgi:predicted transcriptional regulator
MYATSPTQRIVGEFSIERIVSGGPADIWRKFGSVGCIDYDLYAKYYDRSAVAFAISVGETRRFETGVPLSALEPEPTVPQSFMYLDCRRVQAVVEGHSDGQLELFEESGALAAI